VKSDAMVVRGPGLPACECATTLCRVAPKSEMPPKAGRGNKSRNLRRRERTELSASLRQSQIRRTITTQRTIIIGNNSPSILKAKRNRSCRRRSESTRVALGTIVLSGPAKKVLILGAGMAGLVAAYELPKLVTM
jgi:NADPH-dependent 2,4-dienoyl-CoA reductase/sulfur reductase-like enzyme